MKHTLFILAVWLMSAPDSYSQTSKMDDYLVKDAGLASSRRPAASVPAKPQGYMINADPASVSKPTVPQKLQTIIGHTQNLRNTTQILKANTEAIEANTKALQANTEALEANIKAAQTNKHVRAEQRSQATPVPPAPKVPVYSPSVLASKPPVVTPAPAPVAAAPKAAPQPAPVVAAAPKLTPKPQPAPATVVAAAAPKPAVKPAPVEVPKEVVKPPVVAIVKMPAQPVEHPETKAISTMPVTAAPVKAVKPSAMPAEGRTISTMPLAGSIKVVPTVANNDLPNPAAAKPTKPAESSNAMTAMSMVAGAPSTRPSATTMPLPKPAAAPGAAPAAAPAKPVSLAVKMSDVARSSKTANMTDLMQLPLLDKMYDYKISNPKYYAVAPKAGLKHGDIVTTSGYLQVVATDDSGKTSESYSLQLTLNSVKGDSCFIVKIPADQVAALGGKESLENSKKLMRELVKGRVPCTGGNIIRKPVYVTVTGQLVYNGAHASFMRQSKVAYQGRRDMNAYTPWEITASNVSFATAQ